MMLSTSPNCSMEEVDRAMAYCGQTSVQELEPALINISYGWGPYKTAP